MKKLSLLISLLILTACNFDVAPKIKDVSIIVSEVEVFNGVWNGNNVQFKAGAGSFGCNSTDLFVYELDTGAAFLNGDSTQATCEAIILTRIDTSDQTGMPLIGL